MKSLKECLPDVLSGMRTPEKTKRQTLIDSWGAIAGPAVAPHTRPSLADDGRLFVWVDQSSLAFELNQNYRQSILKRVQAVLGEQAVQKVFFRVGQLR
ncbi:MAG TPA: DUF721 domain-containing protein [Verrucomicrobiae bacterium]|nr:DUF721 domain-containing protein [Verrucomicrobiae bacterium]